MIDIHGYEKSSWLETAFFWMLAIPAVCVGMILLGLVRAVDWIRG